MMKLRIVKYWLNNHFSLFQLNAHNMLNNTFMYIKYGILYILQENCKMRIVSEQVMQWSP